MEKMPTARTLLGVLASRSQGRLIREQETGPLTEARGETVGGGHVRGLSRPVAGPRTSQRGETVSGRSGRTTSPPVKTKARGESFYD